MSKVTLIAAAAVGAVTGAVTTALFVGGKKQSPVTTIPTTLPQTSASNRRSPAVPQSVITNLQRDLKNPINPAGLFEYGKLHLSALAPLHRTCEPKLIYFCVQASPAQSMTSPTAKPSSPPTTVAPEIPSG
jgi:hypothetical protein